MTIFLQLLELFPVDPPEIVLIPMDAPFIYQLRRLFLKDEVKGFSLTKELRNLDYDGLGERETLLRVHDYFKKTYLLSGNKDINKVNLEGAGYNFAEEIDSRVLRGIFRTTEICIQTE